MFALGAIGWVGCIWGLEYQLGVGGDGTGGGQGQAR